MIFTKLNTLIMEIMVTVLSIVKHDILIEQMGGEKFLLAMIFFIVCLIITLSDSEKKEDR